MSLVFGLPIVSIVMFFPNDILQVFGNEYLEGSFALEILLLSILPVVVGLSPKAAASAQLATPPESPGGKVKGHTPPQGKAFRWYQIRKQDRYASIAREQLGDEGRWREIFELNRGKFPNADRIREGVRIKLPLTTMAAAGGR